MTTLSEIAKKERKKDLDSFNYRGKKFKVVSRGTQETYWESKDGKYTIILTDNLNDYIGIKGIQFKEDETGEVIQEIKL